MGENADANMFHSKKLPFLCVRIASIMADLPRGFNDDFSSFARGGSDGVKNTKKQHGLLTSDGQKTVLLCCLVRVVIQNFLKKPVISTVFKADE